MRGYSREFLIGAFMSRYIACVGISIEQLESLEKMAGDFYDKVGRDKFRVYASLDAEAVRVYKDSIN